MGRGGSKRAAISRPYIFPQNVCNACLAMRAGGGGGIVMYSEIERIERITYPFLAEYSGNGELSLSILRLEFRVGYKIGKLYLAQTLSEKCVDFVS